MHRRIYRRMTYKATINIDKSEWDGFKQKCTELDTTASAEIRAFIEAFVSSKEYRYVDQADWDKLPKTVQSIGEVIENRVLVNVNFQIENLRTELEKQQCQILNLQKIIETDTKTDIKTDVSQNSEKTLLTRQKIIETDMKTDTKTDVLNSNKNQSSMKNNLETQDIASDSETPKNVSRSYAQDWNRKTYRDSQVAVIEGVDKSAITKRRNRGKGGRDPSFWERWEISKLADARWVKVPGADFSNVGKRE